MGRASLPPGRRPVATGDKIAFTAIFLIHIAVTCQGINEYFLIGHQGWNASLRSTIARNYVRYGLIASKAKPIRNAGPVKNLDEAKVHWHHPPGINLMVAASFALLGESEAAARAVPVLFSLLSFLLLFSIVRRRHGPGAALFACACFTVLPMQVEYGKMVSYEPVIGALGLLALECAERLRTAENARGRPLLIGATCTSLCLAGFVDWPGFILAAVLGVDALLRRPRQWWLFTAIATTTASLCIFLFWWLGEDAGPRGLLDLARSRGGTLRGSSYTALLGITAERCRDYFGWFPIVVGGTWTLLQTWRRRLPSVIVTFGLFNLIYILIFRQGAQVHLFFIYYFTPAVAVATGLGCHELIRRVSSQKWALTTGLLLAALFLTTTLPRLPRTHRRSYHVLPPSRPAQGFPMAGRLDRALFAKMVASMTSVDDVIEYHRSIMLPVQTEYYVGRNYRRTHALDPRSDAALFIASERRISRKAQQQLASRYPVVRTMAYLIYDLRKTGPHVTNYVFRTYPLDTWYWYINSSFYPPHELVEDPAGARAYAGQIGLKWP